MAELDLHVVFQRLSYEMDEMANHVLEIENSTQWIAENRTSALPTEALSALQMLDTLHQSLRALGGFLDAMDDSAFEQVQVDTAKALERIHLVDMERRLAGATPTKDGGLEEIEFF